MTNTSPNRKEYESLTNQDSWRDYHEENGTSSAGVFYGYIDATSELVTAIETILGSTSEQNINGLTTRLSQLCNERMEFVKFLKNYTGPLL
jgi:hypothetical protein